MMKKLLLLGTAIFALNFAGNSQTIEDTLRYFIKKQKYKAPVPAPNSQHPIYKSAAGTIINTGFTHVGSIFRNRSTISVNGLEANVLRPQTVPSPNGNVPTRLYLAKVVNNLPVFPLLDSTNVIFTNQTYYGNGTTHPGQIVGGPLAHGAKVVDGDFAVLIRCTSLQEGDSVFVFRTNGYKPNSIDAPSQDLTFGEALGVVRYQGTFYPTRDFNHPYFGPGTDYEFCVAPRVKYDLEISQEESPIQWGACCFAPFTNTNTSTSAWTSRQFNFNEFNSQLQPFNNLFPTATTYTNGLIWNVGDGSFDVVPVAGSDLVHLGFYGADCNKFHYGTITGDFKKMGPENPVTTYTALGTFTSSTVWCNDTVGTGIRELADLSQVNVYPNPTVDKVTIQGLKGKNTISVYNMFGQLISSQLSDKQETVIDFSKQAMGNYLIRISNSENETRVVKLVKE